jgi:hypothetical protein
MKEEAQKRGNTNLERVTTFEQAGGLIQSAVAGGTGMNACITTPLTGGASGGESWGLMC